MLLDIINQEDFDGRFWKTFARTIYPLFCITFIVLFWILGMVVYNKDSWDVIIVNWTLFSVNNNSGQNCIFLSCVLMAWQGWPKNKESDVSSNTLPKCLLDVLMQTNNLWLFSSNICLSFKHWIRRQLFDPRLVHAFKSLSITLVGWRKSPFYHWKVAIRWTHFEGLYLVLEYSHSQARHVKIWNNFT